MLHTKRNELYSFEEEASHQKSENCTPLISASICQNEIFFLYPIEKLDVKNDVKNDVNNGIKNDVKNDVKNGVKNDVKNWDSFLRHFWRRFLRNFLRQVFLPEVLTIYI